MKKKYSILLPFIYFLLFSSCNRLLIEPDPKGSAEKNFDVFWSDIYNTYPYFKEDNVDWKELYKKYRPMVKVSTSDDALFDILWEMLSNLSDGHIKLVSADGNKYKVTNRYYTYAKKYFPFWDFSTNIRNNYLQSTYGFEIRKNPDDPSKFDTLADFGIINNRIIYFHVRTYETPYHFELKLDSIIKTHPENTGLILDVRFNGGGFLETMQKFAGMFFSSSFTYAKYREKVGPLDNNYEPFSYYSVYPTTNITYSKPMAVLANRFSFSAAEHTVLALKKRAIIIGDTTAGAQSFIIQRTLPNGMQYTMVNSQTFDKDGNLYERVGIPPAINAPWIEANYNAGKDDAVEKALEQLK